MEGRYFGLNMRNGSSPPRRGRKRSRSSSTKSNSADLPNPPRRGHGVAELERIRMQDLLIANHHLNQQSGHFPNQGNQWSSQSGYSSPSFGYSLPSASPPPEYRPHKRRQFGDNNPHPGATLRSNPSAPSSNAETMALQDQQREKDREQEKWDADWLTLSLGTSSWLEPELLDLELKL